MSDLSMLEALFIVGFIVFCGWAGWTNLGGPKR